MDFSYSISSQRHLALEGSHNIRDIGGYQTLDGRYTRWKTILRADSLSHLPHVSQQALLNYGIQTIIDLRSPSEVAKSPNVFSNSKNINYFSLPLVRDKNESVILEQPQTLVERYCLILEYCQKEIKLILETIATTDTIPVLINCTAGKDRTGLIIALLLGIANVAESTIVEDYALSAKYLDSVLEKLRLQARQSGYHMQNVERMLECQHNTMIDTINYLQAKYGGIVDYLSSIGITSEVINYLRTVIVENL